jgi:hypothetical protein
MAKVLSPITVEVSAIESYVSMARKDRDTSFAARRVIS